MKHIRKSVLLLSLLPLAGCAARFHAIPRHARYLTREPKCIYCPDPSYDGPMKPGTTVTIYVYGIISEKGVVLRAWALQPVNGRAVDPRIAKAALRVFKTWRS